MAGLSAVLLTRTPMVFSDAGVPDVAGSRSILEVMFSTEDVIVVLVPNRLPFKLGANLVNFARSLPVLPVMHTLRGSEMQLLGKMLGNVSLGFSAKKIRGKVVKMLDALQQCQHCFTRCLD